MKFIVNEVLPNNSRLLIARLDTHIVNHMWGIRLRPDELHTYRTISNTKRKCEFLSIRKAIQTIYDENEYIAYSAHGKPNLAISGHKISISHSKGLLGILIHPLLEVGIDLQHETPNILKIQKRFLSEPELRETNNDKWKLLAYWCAKEALYKYYSKGNVHFKENLFIEPFELKNSGELYGTIDMPDMSCQIPLQYQILNNTMAVWTTV